MQHGEAESVVGGEGEAGGGHPGPSLVDAVSDRLEGLKALRFELASAIVAGGESTAPLAKQLRDTMADIAAIEKDKPKGSVVDDLASRRKNRGSGTPGVVAAGGDGRE